LPKGGDDASSAAWYSLNKLNLSSLAFDHAEILHDAIDWLVHSPAETMVVLRLLPEVFTVGDVQALFRAFGVPLTRAKKWCEAVEENCLAARLPGRKRLYRSLLVDATLCFRSDFKG
jgi:8-oxo-dGTP diphosphatase